LTPRSALSLNSLHVSMDFPIEAVAGSAFVVDGERGTIPAETADGTAEPRPLRHEGHTRGH
jgi:hypothetical protein